ncbi:sulfate permease [Chamaesiphon sp. VAR_48_metabat_135_sub]|uniref:SulP family inorganic anion transporter n=1 Tax=Chamaesiphon sp. VAR_48_metabat_135_sub TaxID=2964699 RepID=UPI00286B8D13|nr:sulfate permease [Chamaesiphon sp. VAR_48_metabat_135_sub]
MQQRLLLRLPGLRQLLGYQRSWLRGDILAGVTVAAYLIPQCMAYGELVGVPPVVGLWTILPAMFVYALFGSSRQLSVGPESTTAVMTAAAISPLLLADRSNYGVLTATLAVLVGAICAIGYLARLGFLANLLSKPILIGYMAGVAFIMIAGQLGKISGISIPGTTVFAQVNQFIDQIVGVASPVENRVHLITLILAGLVLAFLFAIGHFFPKAPAPLLAVLIATAAVAIFHLDLQGLAVVGAIPAGLPRFIVPNFSAQLPDLLASALGIAIVGYSDNVLTARCFAARHQCKIDANQELLALGLANLGAGLVQGFPVSSSGSRTAIGDNLGSKTQLFSLVAMGVTISVLLWLRPVLALFPKAALGAIVIFAAFKLIEIPEFIRLYRFRRSEFFLAVITTFGVLVTDILVGVEIAVGLSIIELLSRLAHPHDAVQGTVPNLPGLHDINDWEGATTIPGLVIYRYDAPLCFANAEDFKCRALRSIDLEVTPVEWFVLNTEAIAEIDITAMDMLEELYDELAARGITFAMARVKQDLYAQLKRSLLLNKISEDRIYLTLHTMIIGFKSR